jgi:phosphatidylglycerol:prolipoprotein diacylglycerol transferase
MAFAFPDIDPVALDLDIIKIRWYPLAYILGIVLGAMLMKCYSKKYNEKFHQLTNATNQSTYLNILITYITVAIILGGRLGYVLFYDLARYLDYPFDIIKVWQGGMSFHGGFLGVVIACILYSRKYDIKLSIIADYIATVAPVGLFFGRIANFINGELYGRVTDVSWGIIFNKQENLPRHPSQIYEAMLEGLLIFIVANTLMMLTNTPHKKPWLITGLFIVMYGMSRFIVEFFREPDSHIGYMLFELSRGQLLSIPMICVGLALSIFALRNKNQ